MERGKGAILEMPIKLNKEKKEMHLNRKLSGSEKILYPVAAREKGDPSLPSHPSSFLLAANMEAERPAPSRQGRAHTAC